MLNSKTAIITGAGKGIGKAAADADAFARSKSDLETLQAELTQSCGVDVFIATADVADPEEVSAAIGQLTGQLGSIDILINMPAPRPSAPCWKWIPPSGNASCRSI